MHREDFTLCNHKLSLFQAEKADCPLIVFHSFSDEGEAVYQELRKQNAPECNFLFIGDQESKTRHPILKTMQENTEELLGYFRSLEIPCKYELNPGNHFQDVNLRCAKGILELLQ